jgi:hypothetical protein
MPTHASTTVKLAALAMAAPALLLPMKAAGQQMALGGPPGAAAAISDCQKLPTGAERDRCSMKVVVEENNRLATAAGRRADAASVETAANLDEAQCARDLRALRTADPAVVDRGRAILAGRPLATYGTCNLLKDLNKS